MEPTLIALIAVIALLALLALGIHVAVALAGVGMVGLVLLTNPALAGSIISHCLYGAVSNYGLVVLPLFILMGHLAAETGIIEKAMNFAYKWLGGLPGGLALTSTASCAIFATASGSSSATSAAIGKFVIPEMERYGYDKKLATATVAASGTLGILMPPSSVMVVYGVLTEVSIGDLFLAGILPAILSAGIYMIGISIVVKRRPHLGPPVQTFPWKDRFQSIPGLWGVFLLASIVMGGIYGGIFTPTEAGGIGAFAALFLLMMKVRNKRAWGTITAALWDSAKTTSMVLIIMIAAIVFGRFLTLAGVFDMLVTFSTGSLTPFTAVIVIIAISTVMGCFMSGMAVLIILAPIAFSILTSFGYNGVWIGILMVKLFELGGITPPVGMNIYVVKAIAPHVPIADIYRGCSIFIVMDIITIAIIIAFPSISLFIPQLSH